MSLKWWYFWLRTALTVAWILVNLVVRLDLDRGFTRHLRDPAVQMCADHQVIMLIDATELLSDGQPLVAGLEDHLGLACENPSCGHGEKETDEGPSTLSMCFHFRGNSCNSISQERLVNLISHWEMRRMRSRRLHTIVHRFTVNNHNNNVDK